MPWAERRTSWGGNPSADTLGTRERPTSVRLKSSKFRSRYCSAAATVPFAWAIDASGCLRASLAANGGGDQDRRATTISVMSSRGGALPQKDRTSARTPSISSSSLAPRPAAR